MPDGNWRTVYETLWPLRVGNSAKVAFNTLKVVGGAPPTRARMPVNVKKFASTVVVGATMKSLSMSGSPAIAV